MISFYDGQLTDLLPHNLTDDPAAQAYSYALREGTRLLYRYTQLCYVYCNIDTLPDKILDLLAKELRTQYYSNDLDIKIKRKLVKNTLNWYRTAGTPQAVEELITALYGNGKVVEWFDYGGNPGYFQIYVKNVEHVGAGKNKEFKKILSKIKRLSAHLDSIVYVFEYVIKWLIEYENCLTIISRFYPRYNIPALFLDGEGCLNGQYILNGYHETQDISPLLVNGESELNGRYPLDGFRDIQLFDFYPANLLINGYFRQEVNSFGDLSLPIQVSLSVNDNLTMQMYNCFYPRQNVPLFRLDGTQFLNGTHTLNEMDQDFEPLFLNGEGFLDGGYIVNGYRDCNNFDFYPLKVQIKGDCRQKSVVSGFFQSQFHAPLLTERNLCYSVCGKVEEKLHTKENLHFLGSAREMVASKEERLTIEKDLWFLDGKQCFDGEVFLDADIYEMEL